MKKRIRLDHYDKNIIRYLGKRGDSNTNKIAEALDISWKTTNDHLKKLKKYGYVRKYKKGIIVYWSLNY